MQEALREKDSLQFRLGIMEKEKSLLKKHFELVIPPSARVGAQTPGSAAVKENIYRAESEIGMSSFSRLGSRGFDGKLKTNGNGMERPAFEQDNF